MSVLLSRRAVFLAKKEGSYGSDPTPAGADDAFEIISDAVITPGGSMKSRLPYGASISPAQALNTKRWHEISFMVELRGSGSAGTAPKGIGALLQACAMSETIDEGVSVTYAPASSSLSSVTIYAYLDGLLHKFIGAVGTFKVLAQVDNVFLVEFKYMGTYTTPTDVAMATPTYNSTVPPVVKSASFTFDSGSGYFVDKVELDIGNVIGERPSMNEATAVKGFGITSREGKGSMDPEAVLVATKNFFSIWEASTTKALSLVAGATAGNICTISCPAVVLESVGYGDRNGHLTYQIPFRLCRSSGDDEISIAFT